MFRRFGREAGLLSCNVNDWEEEVFIGILLRAKKQDKSGDGGVSEIHAPRYRKDIRWLPGQNLESFGLLGKVSTFEASAVMTFWHRYLVTPTTVLVGLFVALLNLTAQERCAAAVREDAVEGELHLDDHLAVA